MRRSVYSAISFSPGEYLKKNRKLHGALVVLLAVAVFAITVPMSVSTGKVKSDRVLQERDHVQRGPEVGKRVRDLQKYNKNVRAALGHFEKNANRNHNQPKLDEAISIMRDPTGGIAMLNSANTASPLFRKAGLRSQEPDYSEYGVEMILIPAYNTAYEWQGTVILNGFDPSGNYLGQYVADVAIAVDSTETWDVFYENCYYESQSYLLYGNPGFELGTPKDSQDPGLLQPVNNIARKLDVRKAHASAMTPQAPFGGPPGGILARPKVRWVLKCTAIGSAGMAVRCGVALLFGGGPFVPCQAAGSAGVFTVCMLTAIFT
jgi:hypothetical protein